jgi:hypothetical protein
MKSDVIRLTTPSQNLDMIFMEAIAVKFLSLLHKVSEVKEWMRFVNFRVLVGLRDANTIADVAISDLVTVRTRPLLGGGR